jgi:ABC-type nitrate/sulfonate/bicarbonate transport system permease component
VTALRTGAARRRGMRLLQYAGVLAGVIGAWYATALLVANPLIVPSPQAVAFGMVSMAEAGTLGDAVQTSLTRLVTGYGLAVAVCVPLGVAMGLSDALRALFDPVVELLRPISGLAWIPLALVLFGVGDTLVVFIIFYGAAFPIVLNTAAGVRDVDPHLIAASKTFGVSRLTTFLHVTLPGALPTMLVGLRTASGTAWMSLVAAELVGSTVGLGFSLEHFRQLLRTDFMVACIVVIGILGFLTNAVLRLAEKQLTPWAQEELNA